MSASIIAMVLSAALLHATWNALVKHASDRTATIGILMLSTAIPGAVLAAMLPWPGMAALPYLLLSLPVHAGYFYFLDRAYRTGDLSLVYPIARGCTPIMLALMALVLLDEQLTPSGWAGVLLISSGILLLALVRPKLVNNRPSIGLALCTSVAIALYSLVDGVGTRVSVQPLSYISWLFASHALIGGWVLLSQRATLMRMSPRAIGNGVIGGLISCSAYALVLYATTLAPLSAVSALRETSVIIAALIGVLLFRERPIAPRVLAAIVVAIGIALLST